MTKLFQNLEKEKIGITKYFWLGIEEIYQLFCHWTQLRWINQGFHGTQMTLERKTHATQISVRVYKRMRL